MTRLNSVAVLVPPPRPTSPAEVGSAPEWRGVCELPGVPPVDMAVDAGRQALAASGSPAADVRWVVHSGSGAQGALGWPLHHAIQHGVVGAHGNALEIKQYCAGGLTAWMVGTGLVNSGGVVLCTGADNWSFGDRFVTTRSRGGEPFSDVAHAAVLSRDGGFAKILGTGTASCAAQSDVWQTRDSYWEQATLEDFGVAFGRAAAARTEQRDRDSFAMIVGAITGALSDAGISSQYVSAFVPHSLGGGGLGRAVARATGLPWSSSLHSDYLEHGYLGVSTAAFGLVRLATSGALAPAAIVVLLAVEYLLSATAVVLEVIRTPVLSESAGVRTIS